MEPRTSKVGRHCLTLASAFNFGQTCKIWSSDKNSSNTSSKNIKGFKRVNIDSEFEKWKLIKYVSNYLELVVR